MERTYAAQVRGADEIKVCGFVENIRNKSKMAFIVLKDITGKVQITVEKGEDEALDNAVNQITLDSVITVIGKAVESEYVKLGGVEIYPKQIIIESLAAPLPIDREARKGHERSSIDQRIDYRWIDLRTDANQLMFKAQTVMINAMRQFLLERKFMEIHTPKLIGAASESGADVFEVKYFDRKAYLAQSPQFYKQMAMASGFERIFEVGPVFRAEKSFTSKHTTEFSGFDLEFSYIESFRDVMKMEEELLTYALAKVKEAMARTSSACSACRSRRADDAVPGDQAGRPVCRAGKGIRLQVPGGRRRRSDHRGGASLLRVGQEEVRPRVPVHHGLFRRRSAFYHMRDENGVPQGYDLIWRGVEITTGAQRQHQRRLRSRRRLRRRGLDEDVKFYLSCFKYGCPAARRPVWASTA